MLSERARRLLELARDAGQGGTITAGSVEEAEVALTLEEQGRLVGPVVRDPNPGGGDFLDGHGTSWDVKAFRSEVPGRRGGFQLGIALGKIERELDKGENVVIDTRRLSTEHLHSLRQAIQTKGWDLRILWCP